MTIFLPIVLALAVGVASVSASAPTKTRTASDTRQRSEIEVLSIKLAEEKTAVKPTVVVDVITAKPATPASPAVPAKPAEPTVTPAKPAVKAVPATPAIPATPPAKTADVVQPKPTIQAPPPTSPTSPTPAPQPTPTPVVVLTPSPTPAPAPSDIDLAPQRIWLRAEANGNHRVMFSFGNSGTTGGASDGLVQYRVDGRTYSYQLRNLYSQDFMNPGGSITVETNFTFREGGKLVEVVVDPSNMIKETNEQNNGLTVYLEAPRPAVVAPVLTTPPPSVTIPTQSVVATPPAVVTPPPTPTEPVSPSETADIDLVPERIWIRTERDGLQRVVFTFGNHGTTPSPDRGILQYSIDGNIFQYSLAHPGSRKNWTLPGGTDLTETNYLISDTTKTVTVTVDPTNVIPESDETNNTLTVTVIAPRSPLPDLVITSAERTEAGVRLVIKNSGDRAYEGELSWLGGGALKTSVFERTVNGPRLIANGTVPFTGTLGVGESREVLVPAITPRYQHYGNCSLPLLPSGGKGYSAIMQANYAWNDASVGNNQFDF